MALTKVRLLKHDLPDHGLAPVFTTSQRFIAKLRGVTPHTAMGRCRIARRLSSRNKSLVTRSSLLHCSSVTPLCCA